MIHDKNGIMRALVVYSDSDYAANELHPHGAIFVEGVIPRNSYGSNNKFGYLSRARK